MAFHLEKTLLADHDACAITSLAKGKNGKIYLGLTSRTHALYEYDTASGALRDLGPTFPPRQGDNAILDKIHNSLVSDGETLYIGQGLNIDWTVSPYSFDLRAYEGGHLFAYHLQTETLEDLGLQVPLNAIHGLTYDPAFRRLYGYTIPDNHFFQYDIATGRTVDFGKISMYASHNFTADGRGNVYGAWKKDGTYDDAERLSGRFVIKGTFLMKYDAKADTMNRTREMIVYGDEHDIFCNVGVDSWLRTSTGDVYGGTAIGGTIFRVREDDTIEYIGKPVGTPRLTSMVEAPDGTIYGCAGFPFMHIFSLDPRTKAITDHGPLSTEGDFCYAHCMVYGDDGALYAGETDAGKACLYKITIT